jgi:hypothetical protein
MKFKPGERVSFINERQNGVVVRYSSNGKVVVAIEDGFDIEVLEKELVSMGTLPVEQSFEQVSKDIIQQSAKAHEALIALCEPGSVCFAGVPGESGAVLTGPVDFYLINNSDYDLLFTIYLKVDKKWVGTSHGILEPASEKSIIGFNRDELTEISLFRFEALLYHSEKRPLTAFIRKEIPLPFPSIEKVNKKIEGKSAFAGTIVLFKEHEPEPENFKDLLEKYAADQPKSKSKKSATSHIKPDFIQQGTLLNEKTVDLHVEELTDDISNLTNTEMLQLQLRHFAKEMDHAIRNHYKRIFFIHGVGNGVLKRALRDELRKYPGVTFHDGDYSKHGYGATEVVLG